MSGKFPPTPAKTRSRKDVLLLWTSRGALFLLAAALTILIVRFDRREEISSREFSVNEVSPRTVFASIEMTYENKKATETLRGQAIAAIPPVYSVDTVLESRIREEMTNFFKTFEARMVNESSDKKTKGVEIPSGLSRVAVRLLTEPNTLPLIRDAAASLFNEFLLGGVFSAQAIDTLREEGTRKISWIDSQSKERLLLSHELRTPKDLREFAETYLSSDLKKNRSMKSAVLEIAEMFIHPNAVLNAKETDNRKETAANAIAPVMSTIKKSQLIVQKGMIVTEEAYERILQMQQQMQKSKAVNRLLATTLLISVAYLFCFIYLWIFDKRSLYSLPNTALILFSQVTTDFFCKVILLSQISEPYLMPTALAPLLLVLLTRPSLGFLAAFSMTLFSATLIESNIEMVTATLLSGFAAVFAGMRIRKRIQFLKVGASIGLAYFVTFFIFRTFYEYPFAETLQISCFGFANGFLVTLLLCFILVPICESLFQVMTDISLLELSDLNHPLLKRMIVEAPGTYHHSLVVSTLAEGACERIGANALLARVGCYFHDIGKIARAEYFTENQAAKYLINKHEQMTPHMSTLLIMDHVKEGIDLGKKYKLKEPILKFIPEHQGTGIVYYFYRKALDQAKSGEKIDPNDYRYPGPRPQSKETAVSLLSDSTEAASRSLKNPNPDTIRQLVRKIINDKFIDGQLDECDLTLKDLHKIQESFVQNLMAIFHTRVSYPVAPETADKPDLFTEGQFSKYRTDTPPKDR